MTRSIAFKEIDKVISVILGGGAGSRLYPLTKDRAKPAVPLAGKYRLVDIPISLSINSGIKRIFLLTQYLSSSLHKHVQQTYKFDNFRPEGFVELMAAQQTRTSIEWYRGTADAVRQNMHQFRNHKHEYVLILSGDQLYQMDYQQVLAYHQQNNADITVATIPVTREPAKGFGLMHVDENNRIVKFVEKPKENEVLDTLVLDKGVAARFNVPQDKELFLASMGIYIFNREVLEELLADDKYIDFGKEIIPMAIENKRVFSYIHQGYWEDIGTIKAYYEANLQLASVLPPFDFYNPDSPIYTHPRFLPATKIRESQIENSILAEGCIVNRSTIINCLIGIRTRIDEDVVLKDTIIIGSDGYENQEDLENNQRIGRPNLGIGRGCKIHGAIIDKNARIGNNVVITPKKGHKDADLPLYYIRDGIVIIPHGSVVPNDTVI
jgi:glucose-1-phosphate adenylyltransferase